MFNSYQTHTFHIPVMGTGYTIDTPIKVAHLGIDSVISIVDDFLIEKMREFYCKKLNLPYQAITSKIDDFRAKRITAYLSLVHEIVHAKFEDLKKSVLETEKDIKEYVDLLPDFSDLKKKFFDLLSENPVKDEIIKWIEQNINPGSIDVNIMTKVDKENYRNNEKLPPEYNDAHAALRGFANSKLNSSVIFSAGMNPKLYGYIENFDDFYPDEKGYLKKKIVLKVSDYRSALIQGKFLAKKGLWVSEFRIESGLNCGGHAFATQGNLLGPILEEFKNSKQELTTSLNEICFKALSEKSKVIPQNPLSFNITVQGGVGTYSEHAFLLEHYQVNSIGWGSPFLLVDGIVNIDEETRQLLIESTEKDLYLSHISPLGVPFNTVRGNSKEKEKKKLISEGKPGSICPKQLLIQNTEYTERPICTASKQFQKIKIRELHNENPKDFEEKFEKVTQKECLCMGLSDTAMKIKGYKGASEKIAASICPGPNIAYFNKRIPLKTMIDHIYGRVNIIDTKNRPNMFLKELMLYINYFKEKVSNFLISGQAGEHVKLINFKENLIEGINYYIELFAKNVDKINGRESSEIEQFVNLRKEINELIDSKTEKMAELN